MLKVISLFAFVLTSANLAFATIPEFFYQPDAKQVVVQHDYSYSSLTIQDSKTKSEVATATNPYLGTVDGHNLNFALMYGFSKSLALSFDVNYAILDNNAGAPSPSSSSGVSDVNLGVLGNTHFGFAHFFYGLGLSVGPEVSDGENTSDGNLSLNPTLGLEFGEGKTTFGIALRGSFNLIESKTENAGGDDIETEGGHVISPSLFLERKLSDGSLVGLSFAYNTTTDSSTRDAPAGTPDVINPDSMALSLYGRIDCGCSKSTFHLVPQVTYMMVDGEAGLKGSETDVESSGAAYSVGLTIRKGF